MEEAIGKKGKVTSLSSLFPPAETHKASELVQDAIVERRKQLDLLKEFISDNANLINVVQTLPNELHHDIMVPFGKAAFFPGRLIHTNEFMVLLGEGYYAERTSKQTVELLKRRGKALDSQVESLKAEIQDLKAQASFFDATAAEAADGLVQIMEDYVEETSSDEVSKAGNSTADVHVSSKTQNVQTKVEDDKYERIFSRIAELEKEEEEAEKANEDDVDEYNEDDLSQSTDQLSLDQEVKFSEVHSSQLLPLHKGESSHGEAPVLNQRTSNEKAFELPRIKESVQSPIEKALELPRIKENTQALAAAGNEVFDHTYQPGANSSKAVIGSIVEHIHNLEVNPTEQTVAHSSKPVSRFKMRRQ